MNWVPRANRALAYKSRSPRIFGPYDPPLAPNKEEDDHQRGRKIDYQLIAAIENIKLGWLIWDFQAVDLLFKVIPHDRCI